MPVIVASVHAAKAGLRRYVYKLCSRTHHQRARSGCGNGLDFASPNASHREQRVTARASFPTPLRLGSAAPIATPERRARGRGFIARALSDEVLRLSAGHPRSGIRRAEETRPAQRLPSRPARRRTRQCADHGALGPDDDGALVRTARGAVRRPDGAELSGGLQLPGRTASLRRSRKALGTSQQQGQREVRSRDDGTARPRLQRAYDFTISRHS